LAQGGGPANNESLTEKDAIILPKEFGFEVGDFEATHKLDGKCLRVPLLNTPVV